MSKLSEAIKSIVEQADAEVSAANAAIGGKDECSEEQILGIVDAICTNRDHETDAAVRADVRAAMKAKAYEFKPESEKPAKK